MPCLPFAGPAGHPGRSLCERRRCSSHRLQFNLFIAQPRATKFCRENFNMSSWLGAFKQRYEREVQGSLQSSLPDMSWHRGSCSPLCLLREERQRWRGQGHTCPRMHWQEGITSTVSYVRCDGTGDQSNTALPTDPKPTEQ